MPHVELNGARIYYEGTGGGPETIVFAHGLMLSGRMFDAQVAALRGHYRCIVYDLRGQGQSAVTPAGYDMDTLTADTVALMRHLQLPPCHFVGLSMGGFIGMRLAVRHPELLRSMTLMGTSASTEPSALLRRLYTRWLRWFGPHPFLGIVLRILFGPDFLHDPARRAERDLWRARVAANDRVGLSRAMRGVIDRPSFHEQLHAIGVRTLVVVGEHDRANPPAEARELHAGIAGAQLVIVPRAGHSATIEEPDALTTALQEFFAG